jgi:hypothetical protein
MEARQPAQRFDSLVAAIWAAIRNSMAGGKGKCRAGSSSLHFEVAEGVDAIHNPHSVRAVEADQNLSSFMAKFTEGVTS